MENSKMKPKQQITHDSWQYTGPLRTASGELPQGCPWNKHFSLCQGELHYPPNDRDMRRIDMTIGLLELNNGRWIARPTMRDRNTIGYSVYSHQFETRDAALRSAVAYVLRMARWRSRDTGEYYVHGYQISPEKAQEVITWAMALLNLEPVKLYHPPAPAIVEAVQGAQLELEFSL